MQTSLGGVQEPRCLLQMLTQSPPGPGGQLSSGREGARMSGVWKRGCSEALWLPPVPEAVSFCSPHSHLCRLVLVESGNQDVSHRCSGNSILFLFNVFWFSYMYVCMYIIHCSKYSYLSGLIFFFLEMDVRKQPAIFFTVVDKLTLILNMSHVFWKEMDFICCR